MSLSRLALRLAAIEALCPAATVLTGPWPTIAGQNVFEERLDSIAQAESPEELEQALAGLENKPIAVVYTEDHHANPYGSVKFPGAENVVTLVVEISIGAQGVVPIFDATGVATEIGTINAPVLDHQIAALLDVLEAQIGWLFDRKHSAPSAALFHKCAGEVRSIHSDPQRAGDRTLRIALRTLKYHIKIRGDDWAPPGSVPATGLASLPEPLRTVASTLPVGSPSRLLCERLVGFMPSPVGLPAPLKEVRTFFGLHGQVPTSSADADVGQIIPMEAS